MPTNVSFIRTAKKRLSHSFHAFFWHTRRSCTFSFTKEPLCLKLLIPASNAIERWGITVELSQECYWEMGDHCWIVAGMLLRDGGSLLNCRRNARWAETTDSCFMNCSTQNAFCSVVAIIALLRHRPREKRGVGLRMRTKRQYLLFRSMWEIYFCVRFDSRNGRLKLLQSFWYAPLYCTIILQCAVQKIQKEGRYETERSINVIFVGDVNFQLRSTC